MKPIIDARLDEPVLIISTNPIASAPEARGSIGRYIDFYNGRRPHSSLDGRTPDQAYFNQLTPVLVAA